MDQQFHEMLQKATAEELRDMNRMIVNELSLRRQYKANRNRAAVRPGQTYLVTGIRGSHNNCRMKVLEVKRTRVSGIFEGEKVPFLVPISCLVVEE